MGLKDVAGLLTSDSETKSRIVDLLTIIGRRQMTFQKLLDESGYKPRYLRFLITKLRSVHLMMGEKHGNEYLYHLSYEGFSTFLKTKYSDAIYNLVKRR
jgi:hypothetical protein